MNQKQRAYALDRITQIARRRRDELKEKHTVKAVRLTYEEKIDLVHEGSVFLVPREDVVLRGYTPTIDMLFDFSLFECPEHLVDEEEYNDKIAKIRAEEARLKDMVMLGNAMEVMGLIAEFDKEEM